MKNKLRIKDSKAPGVQIQIIGVPRIKSAKNNTSFTVYDVTVPEMDQFIRDKIQEFNDSL